MAPISLYKFAFVLAALFAPCRGVRVLDSALDGESSQMSVNAAEQLYRAQVDDLLQDALVGTWETDYIGRSILDFRVFIKKLDESDKRFLTPEEATLHHFSAESNKFTGEHGSNGHRLLTVTKLFPFQTQAGGMLALVNQRFDTQSPTKHTGVLFLDLSSESEGPKWVLQWEHKGLFGNVRRWWRHANTSAASEPLAQDNDARVRGLASSMSQLWQQGCSDDDAESHPLQFFVELSVMIGGGYNAAGLAGQLAANLCLDQRQVAMRIRRWMCFLDKMADYTTRGSNSSGMSSRILSLHRRIVGLLKRLIDSERAGCLPGVCLALVFNIVPYPPFVWPVPSITLDLSFGKSLASMKACAVNSTSNETDLADANALLDEAAGSTPPDRDELKLVKPLIDEERKKVFAVHTSTKQGPSFAMFPMPAGGWQWNIETTVAFNLRRMLKNLGHTKDRLLGRWQTQCQEDREDLFQSLASWGKLAHEIKEDSSDPCQLIVRNTDKISRDHPEADLGTSPLERSPLRLVPYMEQLGGEKYARDELRTIGHGGALIKVRNDGFQVGIYEGFDVFSHVPRAYSHPCKDYATFVNFYQTRVVPAFKDVEDGGDCALSRDALPPLQFGDCRAVVSDGFADLPVYPDMIIGPGGKVVSVTDSQCGRCLGTASYGMPCRFCPGACEEFFGKGKLKCEKPVQRDIQFFDVPSTGSFQSDPRFLCVAAGGRLLQQQGPSRPAR